MYYDLPMIIPDTRQKLRAYRQLKKYGLALEKEKLFFNIFLYQSSKVLIIALHWFKSLYMHYSKHYY